MFTHRFPPESIPFHKYSLTESENMMPWESDIYVILLKQHLEEEVTPEETPAEETPAA